MIALFGNILMEPKNNLPSNTAVFLPYFLITISFIVVMLNRIAILKVILKIVKYVNDNIISTINSIIKQEFVFFTKDDDLSHLNKVMLYIRNNEHTKKIKIVTILKPGKKVSAKLKTDIEFLDREYPGTKIDFIVLEGEFGPQLIKELSAKWKIPVNFMFIASPSDKFPFKIEDLGGVRLIM